MLLLQHQYHFENYRIREHYCSLLALTDRTNSTFQSYQNLWLSSKCFNDVIISIFNNKLVDQRLAKSKSAEGLRSRNWYFLRNRLQNWKRSVFIPIPKKGNAKDCSNYRTVSLISHTSKVMFKILQARLQQYMNHGLPDVQAGFRKGRGTRDQIANIHWIIEKARVPEKYIFLLY